MSREEAMTFKPMTVLGFVVRTGDANRRPHSSRWGLAMSMIWIPSMFWMAAAASGNLFQDRALIEQALDEPARIMLEKAPLSEAIRQISEQSGVRIVMPPDVMRMAPYGGDTLIDRVDIANVSVRDGLTRLFAPLGMYFVVEEDHVRIAARDPIRCLGRAPTWEELDTLAWLESLQPGVNEKDREELLARVQSRSGSVGALRAALQNVGAGAGDEVLTVALAQNGLAWCLSDRLIVVVSKEALLHRMLQWPITLRANNRPLIEVLQTVSDAAGFPVRSEPGAIASLPLPVQRNYSVSVCGRSAEDVFERIAADTGLGFLINAEGVLFYRPAGTSAMPMGADAMRPATGGGSADPFVAKAVRVVGDGQSFEWLIRASELPPDLKEIRQRDLEELFSAIRQSHGRTGN
jgi:hypothetical protein